MKNSTFLSILAVLLLGGSPFHFSHAQKTSNVSEKVYLIDSLMNLYSEYKQFNGSILVAEQGEVIYKSGFGMANNNWDVENKPNTKFRLASLSKQFTAMLTLQLVSQGQLELHSPISKYLPDYPKKVADSITIHHLLTHTSGLNSKK